MLMRIIRTTAPWILLISFSCSTAWSQGPPLSVEAFAEGGASLIRNTTLSVACPQVCTPSGCPPCPGPFSFSNAAGRLFAGARFHMAHDAIEASYSYSPNQVAGYNRLNLFSFNYIRYLSLRSKLQPFATIGLGANRFSGPFTSSNSFRFLWNYGGGADIVLQRHLALRLESETTSVANPTTSLVPVKTLSPAQGLFSGSSKSETVE